MKWTDRKRREAAYAVGIRLEGSTSREMDSPCSSDSRHSRIVQMGTLQVVAVLRKEGDDMESTEGAFV